MTIDLTKPIKVRSILPDGLTTNKTTYEPVPPPYGRQESEAYRRLFEKSPEMLAWMKRAIEGSWINAPQQEFLDFAYDARALIAEIEGPAT